MRRILKGMLIGAAALVSVGAWSAASHAEELRILAWQGYADDDWVKAFEKENNVDVSVVYVGTDDEIWAKIKGSEGQDFDLFAVNTAQLQRYIDLGLTTPYDMSALPNQKETLPRFQDLSKVTGRDAGRQGLCHPLRLRLRSGSSTTGTK